MSGNTNSLRVQYEQKKSLYKKFCQEIMGQLFELLHQGGIALAVPIESRVKSWESILDKCNRREMIPKALEEISDIAGLRIVLLFKRDQKKVCDIISDNFEVIKMENTQDRLSVDQFGYGAVHFEVKLKKEWRSLPTLRELGGLQAEIQVRTASQHIWATASHVLQYKRERHVPKPVLRAINRVAALLETVDLELERVLVARGTYIAQLAKVEGDEPLNTDILQKILAEEFPPENANETGEDLSALLDDLTDFGILNVRSFRELVKKHRKAIFSAEREAVESQKKWKEQSTFKYKPERVAKGVFYTHGGLSRVALRKEFGKKFEEYLREKYLQKNE